MLRLTSKNPTCDPGSRGRRTGSGRCAGGDPCHAGEGADRDQTVSRWWISEFEACEALTDLGLADLLEIVQKPKDLTSFILLYRRWVVERTFA